MRFYSICLILDRNIKVTYVLLYSDMIYLLSVVLEKEQKMSKGEFTYAGKSESDQKVFEKSSC